MSNVDLPITRAELDRFIHAALMLADIPREQAEALYAQYVRSAVSYNRGLPGYIEIIGNDTVKRCAGIKDGPLPVGTSYYDARFGSGDEGYVGSHLFWVKDGVLNLIEYATIRDNSQYRWPNLDQLTMDTVSAADIAARNSNP